MSCMVTTTRLPLRNIFCILRSESMAWFVQCRCMTSASANALSRVMSLPKRAVSTANSPWRLKPFFTNISNLSSTNLSLRHRVRLRLTTSMRSAGSVRFMHNKVASTPFWRNALSSRMEAMAAPPAWSEVLTSSTFKGVEVRGLRGLGG